MLVIFLFSLCWYQCFKVCFGKEFCIHETFETHCKQNEVVFIEKAMYGRQRYGKCLSIEDEPNELIRQSKGFIGCFSDVKHIIETRCAGRQNCELSVVKIQVETNCSKSLLKYLDVNYLCLKGSTQFFRFKLIIITSKISHLKLK